MNLLGDGDLSTCFSGLRNRGTRLMIEVAARKEWCETGAECASATIGYASRFRSLGASIDAFSMDEPFFATRAHGLGDDYSAVVETAEWMRIIRNEFPNTLIISIEPFPAISANDLSWWLQALRDRSAIIGTPFVDMFILDHDWNAAEDPAGVAQVGDAAHDQGLRYGVLFGGLYPSGNCSSDRTWYDGIFYQAQIYANYGVGVNLYSINNFVCRPIAVLPESQQWSFTMSVRDFIWAYIQ